MSSSNEMKIFLARLENVKYILEKEEVCGSSFSYSHLSKSNTVIIDWGWSTSEGAEGSILTIDLEKSVCLYENVGRNGLKEHSKRKEEEFSSLQDVYNKYISSLIS